MHTRAPSTAWTTRGRLSSTWECPAWQSGQRPASGEPHRSRRTCRNSAPPTRLQGDPSSSTTARPASASCRSTESPPPGDSHQQ
eukprot:16443917-Heterocapsa_arctica.AAC.1